MSTDANKNISAADASKRIVVGVDGSEPSMRALEWAVAQAQRSGAALQIVAAFGPGYQYLSRRDADQCMEEDMHEAEIRAKKLAPEIAITDTSYEGPPELALIRESTGADLLVVGSRGLGGFKGLLLGSVSRKCVQRAKCPVVVVIGHPPDSDTATTSGTDSAIESTDRIVVGVDGSIPSIEAVEWAANEAELTGDCLDVLITWEWPTGYGWSPVPTDYDPDHESEVALSDLLRPVREAHPGVSIQATVIEGHPAPVLVKASHDASLLVVGSRGRGEIVGMLLGSVSEHCVAHAHCPVVVMRDGQ